MVGIGPTFMASRLMASRKELFWSIPCLLNYRSQCFTVPELFEKTSTVFYLERHMSCAN